MARIWGIIGAGAVGGYFGFRLAQSGQQVRYLVRGETAEALRSNGLRVTTGGRQYTQPVEAGETPEILTGCDTVLITVKNHDLSSALEAVRQAPGLNGFSITLQNGMGAPYEAIRALGRDRVLAGIAYLGAERTAPGMIVHTGLGRLMVGEMDAPPGARCAEVVKDLEEAGIPACSADRIELEMWKKLAWNAAFNGPTALSRCSPAALATDPEGRALCKVLIEEVIEAARSQGVIIPPEVAEEQIGLSQDLTDLRTSMLQDLEAGRRLETDALYLHTLHVLRKAGRPAPAHQTVGALLTAAESRIRGSPSHGSREASRPSRPGTADNR